MRGENVPVIFGLKLRHLREERGLGLKQLSSLAGMSASYVNEIEKGKKYPKADKILQLSAALEVPYDEMVSLKLSKELTALESFLDSPILQALPLQLIGLTPRDIIDLISHAPKEVSALIHTLVEIAAGYDMHVEHFFYAMLRSYQETHDNYFGEIETAVERFVTARNWDANPPLPLERVRAVLTGELGIEVDETEIAHYPELSVFRSVWVRGPPPRLLINPKLTERQKAFQMGREIGFHDLKLKARGITSSRAEVESFEQVLNDFKASYYAGALLIPEADVVAGLGALFAKEAWDAEGFLAMMNRYQVTAEMFLYRLTQIIPKHFGYKGLHFLRINHDSGSGRYRVAKQLNVGGLLIPAEVGLHEHYCRRWQAVNLLMTLARRQDQGSADHPLIAAQRVRFINSGESYFFITLARPLALTPGTHTSVTLGFQLQPKGKSAVRFLRDPSVPLQDVNETCERCGLSDSECDLRAARPEQFRARQAVDARKKVLDAILSAGPEN